MNDHLHSSPTKIAAELRETLDFENSDQIDFKKIFERLNIRVRQAPLGGRVLGACKVEGLNKLIVISSAITYEPQRRFTLAHELGHILLHHGLVQCKSIDLYGFQSKVQKEVEANKFASALLLPPLIVASKVKKTGVTFRSAKELAEIYNVSLTTVLIAMIETAPESVALFVQEDAKIKYCIRSDSCHFLPRTGAVMDGVGVHTVSEVHTHHEKECDYSDWFQPSAYNEVICAEETEYFNKLGYAMTIVNVYEDDN